MDPTLVDLFLDRHCSFVTAAPSELKRRGPGGRPAPPPEAAQCYIRIRDSAGIRYLIPLGVARARLGLAIPALPASHSPSRPLASFRPYPEQVPILDELRGLVRTYGGALLECYTGFGKTKISLVIALEYGVKTAVVVKNVSHAIQWANELETLAPGSRAVSFLAGSVDDLPGGKQDAHRKRGFCPTLEAARFFFVRADLLCAVSAPGGRAATPLFQNADLSAWEFLIIDETHLHATATRCRAGLLELTGAKWVIGCSGTPEKTGKRVEALMEAFYGPQRAVVIEPPVKPDVRFLDIACSTSEAAYNAARARARAGLDCSTLPEFSLLREALAQDGETNRRIAALAAYLAAPPPGPNRKVLVISDRVAQCRAIQAFVAAAGISATLLIGESRGYDGRAAVTVATYQMVGVGFDQKNSGVDYDRVFDLGILTYSLREASNFVQALGRVMRVRPPTIPVFLWIRYPLMEAFRGHEAAIEEALRARAIEPKTTPEGLFDPAFWKGEVGVHNHAPAVRQGA